ncbi:MAG: ribosome maturation factor RimM [Bryobacteraceae bacterium]
MHARDSGVVLGVDWVTLARLVRPRGIRGELIADNFGSAPERYEALKRVHLFPPDGSCPGERVVEIEWVRAHQGRLIFKLRGVDSIPAAEAFRNFEVRIPLEERPPAPEGEYYHSDLIGCEVVEKDGTTVGEVEGWQELGATGLLKVKGETEILIPFARNICIAIDVEARRIVVDLPEGLKDLNRP